MKSKRLAVASVAGAYLGIYLVLTIFGSYEAVPWSARGPKIYRWAPLGFVDFFRWREPMMLAFLPVWEADRFFWHTEDLADSGRYPIALVDCALGGLTTRFSDVKLLFEWLVLAVYVPAMWSCYRGRKKLGC